MPMDQLCFIELSNKEDEHWEEMFLKSELNYKHINLAKQETNDCLVYSKEDQFVFFNGPIFLEDGSFLLVQNIPNKENNEIRYNFLRLNDDTFEYPPMDGANQIIHVPSNKVPKKSFDIEFGYVLQEETQDKCYEFNYQTINITPPPQTP